MQGFLEIIGYRLHVAIVNSVEVIRTRDDTRVHVHVCSLIHGTLATRRIAHAGITENSGLRQDAVSCLAPLNSPQKT